MLTTRDDDVYAFVPSNAQRDENERNHVAMYDYDPFTGTATVLFDGDTWLGQKPSVEPEPEGAR